MSELMIVVYKPHGKLIAIKPKEFNSKIHEIPVEGRTYEPKEAKGAENLETWTLQALQDEYFKLGRTRAAGKFALNRGYLISRIEKMREEQGLNKIEEAEDQKVEIKNDILEQNVPLRKGIEDLRLEYKELTGKNVSPRYMNDAGWLTKKINEIRNAN